MLASKNLRYKNKVPQELKEPVPWCLSTLLRIILPSVGKSVEHPQVPSHCVCFLWLAGLVLEQTEELVDLEKKPR